MNNNEKEAFVKQWLQVEKAKKNNRPHHNQIKNIINKFNFDCFIDCGVGYVGTEAWSVKDLKPNTTIIGFEPHNERYEMIKDNYVGDLYKLGVGEKEREITGFMGYKGGKSDFWLHGSEKLIEEGHYKKESIQLTTIDKILEKYPNNKNIFVWADIEGSELDMIKGSVETMKNDKIVGFNLELRYDRADEGHCTGIEVQKFLESYGFTNITGPIVKGHKDYLFTKK
jgi:FkbM family methyltransferase